MNESIKELIESLPNEGVDCKGKEWVRCEPKSKNFIDLAGQTFERLYTLFPVKDKKRIEQNGFVNVLAEIL